jgi:XTP/dITP diphosphohydrolase
VSLDELGVPGDPIEDGLTFETNARIKARFAARATGLPALADDSGLEVDALDGRPGVWTRRYAGPNATDEENNTKLLGELDGFPPDRRTARYVCVLALALPPETASFAVGRGRRPGLDVLVTRGTSRGRIALGPRGSGGFGYDPIFEPSIERPGARTFGEYSAEEKHRISHRARAAWRMRPLLEAHGF